MRNVTDQTSTANQNTNIMFNTPPGPNPYRLSDNAEQYGTAGQVTIQRRRLACWLTKATNTHSEYVTFIASPQQQWLCPNLNATLHAQSVLFSVLHAVTNKERPV
jgi:hypothetical protein